MRIRGRAARWRTLLERIGFGLGVILLLVAAGWVKDSLGRDEVAASVPPLRAVLVEVTGDVDTADYTIQVGSEQIQQPGDVPLTWGESTGLTRLVPSGSFVYVSAQLPGDTGILDCRISVDGVTISMGHANGSYGIAQCSGRA
jgi:hypothetical protein